MVGSRFYPAEGAPIRRDATSVSVSPTASGGAMTEGYGLPRATKPVIKPARLAPCVSQGCAATSASFCGSTSSGGMQIYFAARLPMPHLGGCYHPPAHMRQPTPAKQPPPP